VSRTLVVLQPGYLPWLGFFDQVRRCDVFVHYDDVQFDKHGWRNRNRVKAPDGPRWLTVPVRLRGLGKPRIRDVRIDAGAPWARKHLGTLRQLYARAPFAREYLPTLETLLTQPWERLVDLDIALIEQMCGWFGVHRPMHRASDVGVDGDRSGRLLNLCRHFQATRYLSGDAARSYLDAALFARHGIDLEWQGFQHPVYPQLHGGFVPYLSAIDLLLNCGPESRRVLTGAKAMAPGT
jgi:hypothetical protein